MHAQSKRRERLGIVEMLEAIGEILEAKQSLYLAQIVNAFACWRALEKSAKTLNQENRSTFTEATRALENITCASMYIYIYVSL